MALRLHPLALLLGLALGWRALRPSTADAASNALGGPQPLYAGVPYLFFVRMPPAQGAALGVQRQAARDFLATKGATLVMFSPVNVPPEYAPVETAGTEVVSFRVVPEGSSTVQRGKPFYALGTLESVTRLDGLPFARRPE